METGVVEIGGARCVVVGDGEEGGVDDARPLIEAAMEHGAGVVVVAAASLPERFFQLRSGLLGEMTQKLVNYRLRLAVVGDVSSLVSASEAFRDFVVECERGRDVMFVDDMAGLERRLAADQGPTAAG